MRKKHGPVPKYIHVRAPTATMNKTPAFKVPMQTKLRFCPHSSSYGPRMDAATGRLSFAPPLKGREPDIKAKEPGAGPSAAPTTSTGGSFLQLSPRQHRRRRPPLHQRRQLARRTGRSSLPSSPRKRGEGRMLHPNWTATLRLPRHGWRTPPPQGRRMVSTTRSWKRR
jgi:hypothetical protein